MLFFMLLLLKCNVRLMHMHNPIWWFLLQFHQKIQVKHQQCRIIELLRSNQLFHICSLNSVSVFSLLKVNEMRHGVLRRLKNLI